MIDEVYARQQIRRLSGLSFFPVDPVAAKEMVVALRDVAKDEAMALAVIDDLLATATECPKPADIRRAVHSKGAAKEKDYAVPNPTECLVCSDTGFKLEVVERNGEKYDCAVRCGCRKVLGA